jgi:hypothetical protein
MSDKTKWQKIAINKIKSNPNNPRVIRDEKFKKLVKSIEDFPQMLELRPIVVNDDMIVLGGNMRLKACEAAGLKEVPIVIASSLTEDQQKEFIIKDNVGFGEWDWDQLANEWDSEQLNEWGLDLPSDKLINEDDLFNIQLPFYEPSKNKPEIKSLAEIKKTEELIDLINKCEIPEELKTILRHRASFFVDFNFSNIADFYCHSDESIKNIFKKLGLVILAPEDALKEGFIELTENLMEI